MKTFAPAGAGALALAAALLCTAAHAAPGVAPADSFLVVEGDTLWLTEPVEILGSRVPAALPGVVRSVQILDEAELALLPARSVPEQLQNLSSVVTGQRQQYGVQSDLSIRGSTFDQVQVLLDGNDLGDPQTGHHLMNLPLGTHDVARLEVLPGHGSALYGSGAFGGTVNVVSRRPAARDGAELGLMGGGLGTRGAWGSGDLAWGPGGRNGLRVAAEGFHTDGTEFETARGTTTTDADTWSSTGRYLHEGDRGEVDLMIGHAERAYGAPGFYAPYPSWEKTRATFASARWNRTVSRAVTLEPRLFYRHHTDHFVLLRDNPAAYTNDHATNRFGGDVRGLVALGEGHALAAGLEGVYEDIDSQGIRGGVSGPALGNHLRRRLALAAEVDRHGAPLRWQLGARVDTRSVYGTHPSFTGAVAWDQPGPWTLRVSAGSVYRVPTFTDLYYDDPANKGNPDLQPEKGWAWDAGVEAHEGPWFGRVVYFERHERDLIDWARPLGAEIWQVLNVSEGLASGVETQIRWRGTRGHGLELGYTLQDRETSLLPGYEAKYALIVPRQVLKFAGTAILPADLALTVSGRYLERNEGPQGFRVAFVLDARLEWTHRRGWRVGVTGTNLLDRAYQEVPGVPMPGTLLTSTVGKRF